MDQVGIEKMNESEPLMKCRENAHSVKTYRMIAPEDKHSGNLFTDYVADVMKEA